MVISAWSSGTALETIGGAVGSKRTWLKGAGSGALISIWLSPEYLYSLPASITCQNRDSYFFDPRWVRKEMRNVTQISWQSNAILEICQSLNESLKRI